MTILSVHASMRSSAPARMVLFTSGDGPGMMPPGQRGCAHRPDIAMCPARIESSAPAAHRCACYRLSRSSGASILLLTQQPTSITWCPSPRPAADKLSGAPSSSMAVLPAAPLSGPTWYPFFLMGAVSGEYSETKSTDPRKDGWSASRTEVYAGLHAAGPRGEPGAWPPCRCL